MGTGSSRTQQPPGQNRPGLFNRAKGLFSRNPTQQSQFQQPGTVIPQQIFSIWSLF